MTQQEIDAAHEKLKKMGEDYKCPFCDKKTETDIWIGQYYLALICNCHKCPACMTYHFYVQ